MSVINREVGPPRTMAYSPRGTYLAFVDTTGLHVVEADTSQQILHDPSKAIVDMAFSPLETYLMTWERPTKVEEGQPPHQNLQVFHIKDNQRVWGVSHKAQNKWLLFLFYVLFIIYLLFAEGNTDT